MGWRLNRFLFFVAVILASVVATLELQPTPVVPMPPVERPIYPPARTVPTSWAQFAQLVQDQFKALLEANNSTAERFRLFLKNQANSGDFPSTALLVHVWVGADGKVKRVDFPALLDRQADADLHAILERGNIGRPPADMPQPLLVKLALDW
jgi:hypothetical protein